MLQNLLAERFKLTLHRVTEELRIYALVVGAKGPKLKDSTVADRPPASDSQPKQGGRAEAGAEAFFYDEDEFTSDEETEEMGFETSDLNEVEDIVLLLQKLKELSDTNLDDLDADV